MFSQFSTHMRITAIFCFVFVFALSIAWANGGTPVLSTYSGSVIIENGSDKPAIIPLVKVGADHIKVEIAAGSLDAYMAEENLYDVEITCLYTQQWVEPDEEDDDGHYKMKFVFSPSGAFFDPEPLILKVKGKWVATDSEFWLYDENDEALAGTRHKEVDVIKFEIPHFSCYYYESYCY